MLQARQNQENQESLQQSETQSKKRRFWIPIIVTALVLVLAGIGGLVYFLMK
jgi:flagellar basal body-associated protein FliL